MEDVICSEERNLNKEMLLKLMDCTFIDRAENLLIDGKTGCGKVLLGMCCRKAGMLHGTQSGILFHEQVRRADSARQT